MTKQNEDNRMIFLSSPYSDSSPSVVEGRYEDAVSAVAALSKANNEPVFSVIVYGHPLVKKGLPNTFEFWDKMIRSTMSCCSRVIVLQLHGWSSSDGVSREISIAKELQKPVELMSLADVLKVGE